MNKVDVKYDPVNYVLSSWRGKRGATFSLVSLLFVLSLVVLMTLHNFLMVQGDLREDGSSIYGWSAQIIAGMLSILFSYKILYFYSKRILFLDLILLTYIAFSFFGIKDLTLESVTPLIRLLIFFYCVPYFLSYAKYFSRSDNIFMLVTILSIWGIVALALFSEDLGREVVGGTRGAQLAIFYLAMGLICYICAKKTLAHKTQWSIVILGVMSIIAISASRQGVVGAILFAFLALFAQKLSALRVVLLMLFGVLLLAILTLAAETSSLPIDRLFDYSYETWERRLARYSYFSNIFFEDFSNRFFTGGEIVPLGEKLYYRGVWIDGAGHNVYLVNAVRFGIASTCFLLMFHLVLGVKCFRLCLQHTENPIAVVAFSYLAVVYIISQFENFLVQVSNLPAFAFYVVAGFLVNIIREQGIQRVSTLKYS